MSLPLSDDARYILRRGDLLEHGFCDGICVLYLFLYFTIYWLR